MDIKKEFNKIHRYTKCDPEIENLDINIKIDAVLYGIENERLFGTSDGNYFGVELHFQSFNIMADEFRLVVFSDLGDLINPIYLRLSSTDDRFFEIYSKIKHFIIKHKQDEASFLITGYNR